jgi:hypothetical protein
MFDSTQNSDEIILLVSPDETDSVEGQRGWGEDIRKRVSALVEVRVDPSVLSSTWL